MTSLMLTGPKPRWNKMPTVYYNLQHHDLDSQTLQSLALQAGCRANYLHNEVKVSHNNLRQMTNGNTSPGDGAHNRLPLTILSCVSDAVCAIKLLVSWMDRWGCGDLKHSFFHLWYLGTILATARLKYLWGGRWKHILSPYLRTHQIITGGEGTTVSWSLTCFLCLSILRCMKFKSKAVFPDILWTPVRGNQGAGRMALKT